MLEKMHLLSEITMNQASADATGAGEDFALGLGVTALGLAVVFSGLVLLIFITYLYPKLLKALLSKKKADKKAGRVQPGQKTVIATAAVGQAQSIKSISSPDIVDEETDAALVAVITAAVASSLGKPTNGIMIKSLRRSGTNIPAWGTNGRIEQITNRL